MPVATLEPPVPPPPGIARGGPARVAGRALQRACTRHDGWADPAPPAPIFGNTSFVGTCGISVLLITTPHGAILVDGGPADAAPLVLANIRALGVDPRSIRLIIGSHEHADHMGALAALKAATGAQLWLSAPAASVLATGLPDPADPQIGLLPALAPVEADGTVIPGTIPDVAAARDVGLMPVATPGHTSGGTSWSWRSCEGERCLTIAFVDSLTAAARNGYRFTDHPERVAPFRTSFAAVEHMPCDLMVTGHPDFSDLFARLSGASPLIDRDACRRLAHRMAARLDTRLAGESAGRPPLP